MGVGFGTNLNNNLGLFTPFVHFSRKERVRLWKSCCCVHLPTGKGICPGRGEEWSLLGTAQLDSLRGGG